jgi:DNA-binding NtrC family response regulator
LRKCCLLSEEERRADLIPVAGSALPAQVGDHLAAVGERRSGRQRESENAVERAIITRKSRILSEEDFLFVNHGQDRETWDVPAQMTLEQIENQVITTTLHRTHGNIKEAASILGVDRSTLYDRLNKYHLPRNQ